MNTVWDILYARRPVLNYVSPPVCEVIFSGSSNPVIILSEPTLTQVTGLVLGGAGGFTLSWNAFPGAICYNIYWISQTNVAVLLAQCITDPTFTLPPGLDPGEIVVTAITPEGETPPSEPVIYPSGGGGGCIPQSGAPSPSGMEAFNIPVDEMMVPIAIERAIIDFFPNIEIVKPTFPPRYFRQEFGDYPPGHYDFGYVSGFFPNTNPLPPGVVEGGTIINWGMDTNHPGLIFNGSGGVIGDSRLVNNLYTVNPPVPILAAGINFPGPDYDNVEAQAQVFFNTPGFEKRWKFDQKHENDGGKISAAVDTSALPSGAVTHLVGHEFLISLVQVDGLIQQPRKVRIVAWNAIKSNFPAAIRDNWDGTFPVRTVYTETTLTYTAAPSGPFPGATCYYTQSHPTAPNGCGWVVQIGAYWTGLLEVGDQPTGIYLQSAPVSPGCVEIEEYE